jgi:rhodanese-related sulfurtransferase
MKRSLLQAVVIILFSGIMGLAVNGFRPDGIPWVENWQGKVLNEQLTGGLPAVSLKEAREAYEEGYALFVDARDPDFFKTGHIPGAVNLPVKDFDRVFPTLNERLLAAPRVITYCDGASCEMSVELTEKLLFAGLEYVEIFTGGIQQWKAAGQPLSSEPAGS